MLDITNRFSDGRSAHQTYGGDEGGKDSGLHVDQRIDDENYVNIGSPFLRRWLQEAKKTFGSSRLSLDTVGASRLMRYLPRVPSLQELF